MKGIPQGDHTELVYEHNFPEDRLRDVRQVLRRANKRVAKETVVVEPGKLSFRVQHSHVQQRDGESLRAFHRRRDLAVRSVAIRVVGCVGKKAKAKRRKQNWVPPLTVKRSHGRRSDTSKWQSA